MGDGLEHKSRDLEPLIADHFNLSKEDRVDRLPSGTQRTLLNRVQWSVYDMFRAGLLDRRTKGIYFITDEGRKVLDQAPDKIDRQFLLQFPAFKEWQIRSNKNRNTNKGSRDAESSISDASEETPDELMATAHSILRSALASELLEEVKKMEPIAFEKLVVDLMVQMGYGGPKEDSSWVTQQTGDEGIDGVINQDRLGLDVIYLQAKRYTEQKISRPAVQGFVGALAGQQATKGVFMTTSSFSKEAISYANNVAQKVILIDGPRLAELMIEHNLGVSIQHTYEVKRIDSDYFDGE